MQDRQRDSRATAVLLLQSISLILLMAVAILPSAAAQEPLPFSVLNSKKQRWSQTEALRIYDSACSLVARTVRPEKPPHLHPNFLLVLGANDNELVRNSNNLAEIHLKTWDATKFAEAVVIMASRDVLHADDLATLARQSVTSAQSTISLDELKQNR